MEKAKQEKEAHGEIETAHPGYLGAQDTYYVGTIKSIGKIYQQTFIDTYTKVAFAKLYDRKNALVAADMLNDRVLPFFEEQDVSLLRILTDRGTEYCGQREHHEYQLYLAVENIDHSRTKAYSPQTNGICERFHRTMQDEFYSVAFRKRLYNTLDELQADVDAWLREYNEERPHTGKYCFGKTPVQTFRDSKHLSDEKQLDRMPVKTSSDGLPLLLVAHRAIPGTCVSRSVSGTCEIVRCSPQSVPFPPQPPPRLAPLCSIGSQVLRHSPTSPVRACPPFGFWPSRTGLDPSTKTYKRSPGSRACCFSACAGS